MNYLGIDLAYSNIGWVVVEPCKLELRGFGVIRTKRETKKRKTTVTLDDVRRLEHIASTLQVIVRDYRVGAITAEFPGGSQSAVSAKSFGMAIGALVVLSTALNVPLDPQTPAKVKRAVCGSKDASKEAIAKAVCKRWPELEQVKPVGLREHVTDAAATILASRDGEVYHRLFLLSWWVRLGLQRQGLPTDGM